MKWPQREHVVLYALQKFSEHTGYAHSRVSSATRFGSRLYERLKAGHAITLTVAFHTLEYVANCLKQSPASLIKEAENHYRKHPDALDALTEAQLTKQTRRGGKSNV
jgi:hypothetical protein